MQTLAVNGYTKQEVIDALHSYRRTVTFKYEHLDENNAHQGWLDGVMSCTVENNTLASIKRTAKIGMQDTTDIDWLKDRIRPWFRLLMPDGGWAEWPQGVFLLVTPTRDVDEYGSWRMIEAYDQLTILSDDLVASRYFVAQGTNYITAIDTILTGAGVDQSNLVATDKTLPSDREWSPGTSKLEIIQDLLSAINYRSLFFDASGAAVAKPYQAPDERGTGYSYVTNDKSLVAPAASAEFDLFKVPNQWVLTVSEPETPPLVSTYTNNNADSPTSTVSRGRTITHFEQVESADQATLDGKVARLAFESSQVYDSVEFETALMPHHEDNEVIELSYPEVRPLARFTEHKWSMELRAGAKMKHRIRRVVTI